MNHSEILLLSSNSRDGWIAVAPYRMPPVETVVIGWHGEHECPLAVFYDTSGTGKPQWSVKADGEALPLRAITHWRHVNRPSEAAPSEQVLVLQAPYCTLHISEDGFIDHVSMRTTALADLLRLAAADDPNNFMTSLCARLAGDLRDAYEDTPRALLLTKQLAEIFLNEQTDTEAGALLWLCQQIADELLAVLSVMTQNGSKGVAA